MSNRTAGNSTTNQALNNAANSTAPNFAKLTDANANTFFASLAAAFGLFGVQLLVFLLIKGKFPRIYRPRTFIVPEKERIKEPPTGLWRWVIPVFKTSNSEFIQKCGLDAYFFLRYLRMLLKIFVPLSILIIPILLPINKVGGKGEHFVDGDGNIYAGKPEWSNIMGFNQYSWTNIHPDKTHRYWAHLVLAIVVVAYSCYVFYDELKGYIRLRQAYLTSPQHRLRASATTVLVSAIPRKWCTRDALDGLYDVFPGGIRNIWINRNYDQLNDKVKLRTKIHLKLEQAETNLIKNAKKAHAKTLAKEGKQAGHKQTKEQRAVDRKRQDERAEALASGGTGHGNPHQVHHTLEGALNDASSISSSDSSNSEKRKLRVPIPVVGQGIEAVGQGVSRLGKSILGGLKSATKDVDERLQMSGGLEITDEERLGLSTHDDMVGDGVAPGYRVQDSPVEERSDPISRSKAVGVSTSSAQTAIDDSSHAKTVRDVTGGSHQINRGANTTSPETATEGTTDALHDNNPSFGSSRPLAKTEGDPQSARLDGDKTNIEFWNKGRNLVNFPSPTPHGHDEGYFNEKTGNKNPIASIWGKLHGDGEPEEEYPSALSPTYNPEEQGEPAWTKHLTKKDRETMTLKVFGQTWLRWIPFIGEKVDLIDHCRKELARLNLEIEQDQEDEGKYPLMNSAFIQFNHQIAAHMACQSISHHMPNQMDPRAVEISPNDVIWDNMHIKWWERYLRTFGIIVLIVALIVGWAIPVGFTAFLNNIDQVANNYHWLSFLAHIPDTPKSILQGVLPPVLLAVLLAVLPLLLRYLARIQGLTSHMAVELMVQHYYFGFLFVQVFLVVTMASAISHILEQLSAGGVQSIPGILADNLPRASNYFFSYLLLQALSVSAGTLVQLVSLAFWFVLGPILDSTARAKWSRQVQLPEIQWGTFFPTYTNLAVIGIIYSVISPLIMVFNIVTFALFWFVYRYNTLYVTKFRGDTGGLLFPAAINQLFIGLYFMELCLVGLFFIVVESDDKGNATTTLPCKPQAIIMIVVLILTLAYQWLLNRSFAPLFRYLPITLEDEAVIRDEEFQRAQDKRFKLADEEEDGDDINDVLEERERKSEEEDRQAEEIEMKNIRDRKSRHLVPSKIAGLGSSALGVIPKKLNWADKSREDRQSRDNWAHKTTHAVDVNSSPERPMKHQQPANRQRQQATKDLESQGGTNLIANALFSNIHDDIEDLTPEQRDILVQRAFKHEALRAKRPVIWLPRDELGVSDDEIRRTRKLSKYLWISNQFTGLDSKTRVIYRRPPPDFSETDLIEL